MADKKRNITLGDFIALQRGHDLTDSERREGSVPVVGAAGPNGFHDTALVNGPGIVVGRSGAAFGKVYYCREDFWPHNTGLYVTDFKENDPSFAYYFLKNINFSQFNSGSAQPSLNRNYIYPIRIQVPLIVEQRRISSVLSALDGKIEINNQINAELEGMAKLLYDWWFVQFEFPMTAAQAATLGRPALAGHPYKSSGGKLVHDQTLNRPIPVGWEVKHLGEIEDNIVTGKTPPTADQSNFGGEIPFICIGDVRGNMHIVKTALTLSVQGANLQKNKYIRAGSICVTCIASPGLVAFATQDSQTNQQLNSIVVKHPENRSFLYFYLRDYFANSTGAKTGNTFANMNKGDFSAIETIKPEKDTLIAFTKTISDSVTLILNNQKQNQELTALRDWLLPMLMNGQVTVG